MGLLAIIYLTNKRVKMSIEIQIINIINDKLKNPIYTTMKLLNLKTILTKILHKKGRGCRPYGDTPFCLYVGNK